MANPYQFAPSSPKLHLPRPKPIATHIPKPNPLFSSLPRPLPGPSSKPPCCILHPHATAVCACPNVEDLHLHQSTLNPHASANASSEKHRMPSAPQLVLTPPATPEELETESPSLQCDSTTESDSIPGQPSQHCIILASPMAAHHLQWSSPQSTPWQTTG